MVGLIGHDRVAIERELVVFVSSGGLGGDVAGVAIHPNVVRVPAIAGRALPRDSVGEDEGEMVGVLDLFEELAAPFFAGADDLDGVGSGEVAHRLDGVDADLADGAIAADGAFVVPLAPVAEGESVVAPDVSNRAAFALSAEPHGLEVVGFKVASIADAEALFELLCLVYHFDRLLQVAGHRLFAHHVFTGAKGAEREFVVGAGRGDDVDDLDLGVVGDCFEVLVSVNLAFGQGVLRGDPFGLIGSAADDGFQRGALAMPQVGHDVARRVAAEAEDCPPDGLSVVDARENRCSAGGKQVASSEFHVAILRCLLSHVRGIGRPRRGAPS